MEDNTIINGLLKLRTETAQQVGYARKRLAELSHDLEAIEHVLTAMGHYERPPTPLTRAVRASFAVNTASNSVEKIPSLSLKPLTFIVPFLSSAMARSVRVRSFNCGLDAPSRCLP